MRHHRGSRGGAMSHTAVRRCRRRGVARRTRQRRELSRRHTRLIHVEIERVSGRARDAHVRHASRERGGAVRRAIGRRARRRWSREVSGALRLDREDFANVVRVREAAQADLAATPVLRADVGRVSLRRSTHVLVIRRATYDKAAGATTPVTGLDDHRTLIARVDDRLVGIRTQMLGRRKLIERRDATIVQRGDAFHIGRAQGVATRRSSRDSSRRRDRHEPSVSGLSRNGVEFSLGAKSVWSDSVTRFRWRMTGRDTL